MLMLILMQIDDCVAATRSTANVKSSGWLVSVIGVARGGKFRRGGSRHWVPGRAGVVPGPVRGERGDVARTQRRPVRPLPWGAHAEPQKSIKRDSVYVMERRERTG